MSASRVLLLSPSRGLGGGIQRYLASVLSELFDDDALRLSLASAGRALSRSRFEPGVYADLVLRRLL